MTDRIFMEKAIELSIKAVEHGNEPFGALLVKDGEIVFTNENQIYTKNDPTFHAEFGLIRRFIEETGITDLSRIISCDNWRSLYAASRAVIYNRRDIQRN